MEISTEGLGVLVQADLNDGAGTPITSTTQGTAQGLDVNIVGGSVNSSTGVVGSPVPLDAEFVGFKDSGGNLAPVVLTAAGNLPVDVQASVLPTGASTSANQTTANTSLASIDGKLTDTANGLKVDGSGVTQPISATTLPLPTGAATSANQTTANTALSAIETSVANIPAQGAALTAASTPVNIASDQVVPVSASALPLPTGAATSANQATEITSLGNIDTSTAAINTKTPALGQAAMAASVPVVIASDQSAIPVTGTITTTQAGLSALGHLRNDYTVTSVTTSAYVQLLASLTGTAQEVEIFDSSGQTLVLAFGGSGSEVDQIYITPGGNGRVRLAIPNATRLSIKAVSGTASTGEIDINIYG